MKRLGSLFVLLPVLLMAALVFAQVNRDNAPIMPKPGTPAEVAWLEYQKADKEMNAVYQLLAEAYGTGQKEAKARLLAAQLAWIKYRDLAASSEISLVGEAHENSEPHSRALKTLTEERTTRLKQMLRALEVLTRKSGGMAEMNARVKKSIEQLDQMDAGKPAK